MIAAIREIPRLKKKIDRDREQLFYLEEKATCIPSAAGSMGDKVQHSVENRAGMYVDAAVDLAKEIEIEERELKLRQTMAHGIIQQVSDKRARRVLTYRYIDVIDWDMIADLTGYTVRRVHQIEREALLKFS